MNKRFLAIVLTLCMVMSMLPVSAFAAPGEPGYEIGDTFETTDPDQEPPEDIPDGTEWVGPDAEQGDLICEEEEHAHSLGGCYDHQCTHEHDDDCYPTQWVKCTKEDNPDHYNRLGFHKDDTECKRHYFGGLDYTWGYQVIDKTEGPTECRHKCSLETGCYTLTCNKKEHQHGDACYQWTYTWTLEEKTDENERGDQWRNWWPVYWSFDEYYGWGNEEITEPSLVTVSAGTKDVTYTKDDVSPQDALDDPEAANAGQLIRSGLDIRVAEGYYLSSYRLVCGNYTRCGVVEYDDAVTIEPDENGDYSAVTHVSIDKNDFDHWHNVGGLGRNYPTSKPSEANQSNSYLGGNIIYPFYLLLELKEDENTYQIQYDWGDQSEALTEYDVPEPQTGLKRNEEVQAAVPSDEAVQAALATGYVFDGWTISGTGYEDGSEVDAGGKVVIRGSNLTLTAKWVEAGTPEFLKNIKVTVSCTNQTASHTSSQPMTLTAEDYTTSSRVVDRHLEYTVTISSDRFVAAYNEATGATHTPAKDTATVTYVYDNGWELKSGSSEAVTFQVACEDQYTVTVKYVMDDADQTEIKTPYVSEEMSKDSPYDVNSQIPDSITYKGQNYAKDTVRGATSGTLTSNVEITAVYSLDEVGGENGGGDGVPDKYQKKVTFRVVNGTWADDTSADKVTYVTLMKDGKWDVNGSAALTAPAGMKPGTGYGGTDGTQGGWDTTPPTTVSGTDDVMYTYTFAKSTTPIVPGNVLYIVEHYKANDDGTYPETATETERFSGAIGAEVTATSKAYEGYCLDSTVSNTTGTLRKIEKPEDIVTLKLYYAVDKVGGEDGGGDGVPDKYQKKVTFRVVNGTWADDTSADKVTYVTLMKDGKWDVNGSAALTAPTEMKPGTGYGGTDGTQGSWDTTPPATVSGTDDVTYTYTFAKSTTPIVPGNVLYVVEHYKASENGTYPETATETERFSGAIGAEVTATSKAYEGYCLDPALSNTTGTLRKIEKPEDIVTLKLYYAVDKVGGEDGGGDGVPDKYQKKVTFQVVNGTWADGNSADKVTYVTLMKDGKWDVNGSAILTSPTGMNAKPGYGGTDGTQGGWDTTPPATVSGTDDVTYTYTFAKSTTPIVPGNVLYIVEHYKANDDGTYPETATETERFSGAIGAKVTAIPKNYAGYCLDPALSNTTGTLTQIEEQADIVTLKLYYAVDKIGGEDGGDGTPDQYQAQVIYQVVGGTWADGSTEIEQVYHLSEYDETSNKWVEVSPAPTLADIPDTTKVKPDAAHILSGTWENQTPTAGAALTAGTSTTYTYRLTAAAPAMTVEKTAQETSVSVGEQIHYTITVHNTGNAALTNVTIEDTLWSAGMVIRVGGTDQTLSGSSYTISSIGVGEEVVITYAYTAAQTDVAAGVTNTATVTADEIENAVTDTTDPVPVTAYSLTYDANGGRIAGGTTFVVPNLAQQTGYNLGEEDDYTAPTHTDTEGAAVLFLGWTTTDNHEKIYDAGEQLPTLVSEVNIPAVATVYAVWAYDRDGDGTPDARQIMIQPAAITIYAGGRGYEGVVTDNAGNTVEGDEAAANGLPTPGYYLTLPYDLNQMLREDSDGNGPVNLAEKLRFVSTDGGVHSWVLKLYNEDSPNSSMAYERYIYQMEAVEAGQEPVRLEIWDGNTYVTSDQFDVSTVDGLYTQYQMKLYSGAVEDGKVTVQMTNQNGDWVDVGTETASGLGMLESTLTIRGTHDETPTHNTPVASTVAEVAANTNIANETSNTTITALAKEGTVYNINGSQIPTDGDIRLLTDGILDDSQLEDYILNNKLVSAEELKSESVQIDYQYLDLVDYSDGNAYVTLDQGYSMTLYWKLPDGADRNGSFQVVHFDGLDRNYDLDDLDNLIGDKDHKVEVYSTENGKLGLVQIDGSWYLKFDTSTFSPFALIWDVKDSEDVDDDDDHDDDTYYQIEVIIGRHGDITPDGGSNHIVTVLEGNDKTFHIEADEGYQIVDVLVDDRSVGARSSYTFKDVDDDHTIEAVFDRAFADPDDTGVSRWLNTDDHDLYMVGYPDGTFGPDRNMTRAEAAVMFYALLNNQNVAITQSFSDVPAGTWYTQAVNTLATLGMIEGYEDGTFRPNNTITRAEFATMAVAFTTGLTGADCGFSDVHKTDWFYSFVAQATSYGWISDQRSSQFRPADRITRAEVSEIVNKMLGRAADQDYVDAHVDDLITFTDVPESYWAYYSIMETTNSHDYGRDNGMEEWTDINN